jgi:FkbM family methyltransferase
MTASHANTPPSEPQAELPLIFRVTAGGRRLLPQAGVTLLHRSIVARPLRRVLASAAPAGPRQVTVCGGQMKGVTLHVDLAREKYYWLGTHEERIQEALARLVRPGFVVYDIGAHIGFFSLLCSRLAGGSGRVFAFEPRAENIARLKINIQANAARNVEVVAAAASDSTGEAAFAMHESTLEGALVPDGDASAVRVRTESVDALVAGGMPPPDLIKVDVEGAEAAVIRGAARTIDAHRPLMLLEVHSAEAGRGVAAAMPCRYVFRDIDTGMEFAEPLAAAHYLAQPVAGPERMS